MLGVKLICNVQSSSKEIVMRTVLLNPNVDILECYSNL